MHRQAIELISRYERTFPTQTRTDSMDLAILLGAKEVTSTFSTASAVSASSSEVVFEEVSFLRQKMKGKQRRRTIRYSFFKSIPTTERGSVSLYLELRPFSQAEWAYWDGVLLT